MRGIASVFIESALHALAAALIVVGCAGARPVPFPELRDEEQCKIVRDVLASSRWTRSWAESHERPIPVIVTYQKDADGTASAHEQSCRCISDEYRVASSTELKCVSYAIRVALSGDGDTACVVSYIALYECAAGTGTAREKGIVLRGYTRGKLVRDRANGVFDVINDDTCME